MPTTNLTSPVFHPSASGKPRSPDGRARGGAGPWRLAEHLVSAAGPHANSPPLTNTELVQLQIRVIALENLVIALLAEGSDRQIVLAREMADYISPRPGFTHHRLTIHAAAEMVSLVKRAGAFR